MPLVNQAISDTFILRDDADAALTGKVAGDFDVLEAYALPSGATTATVTLTEIGGGEYAITFTPTTVGTWAAHVVYDSGGVFREYSNTYDVTTATSAVGAGVTGASYATLDQIKSRLNLTNDDENTKLEQMVAAASRQIDGFTNRVFFLESTAARIFTTEFGDLLWIDDLVTLTTLKTDEDGDRVYETTWAATDYDLEPYNAAGASQPYTSIRTAPNGTQTFPTHRRGVQITGDWGYASSVPNAITEACLILAQRFYVRKNAPFGVAGSTDLGQAQLVIPSLDPDVKQLIMPFRRMTAGAV